MYFIHNYGQIAKHADLIQKPLNNVNLGYHIVPSEIPMAMNVSSSRDILPQKKVVYGSPIGVAHLEDA